MEIEVSKDNVCINKLVTKKKELIFIQDDLIVPDSKPDILNAINCNGTICIYKKEILDNKIKIEGSINTYIMYLPDSKEDNVRGLNCNIDFSENIACQGVKEGMILAIKPILKDIDCKVLNGRKINLKAGIEFNIEVYSNEDIEMINKINNIEDIQLLEESCKINSLIGVGRTTVYAKETLSIKAQDELAEILKVDAKIINEDYKISYNKILAKADLGVNIIYLTEDNRLEKCSENIPLVGFVDIQNIVDENICDVSYEIKNMIIKPNSAEEHSIYVEFEIEILCMAYEKKQINLIKDMYSPQFKIEYTLKKLSSSSDRIIQKNEFTLNCKEHIPEIETNNVLDIETNVNLINIQITNSKITYIGELIFNFIYVNSNTVNSKKTKISFEESIENSLGTEKIDLDSQIFVSNIDFNVKPNEEIECNAEIQIIAKMCKNVSLDLIDDIEVIENKGQENNYNSLILYIVKKRRFFMEYR